MENRNEDPNLILIIRARVENAIEIFSLPHNNERCIATIREPTPDPEADNYNSGEEDAPYGSLHLTFNKPPTNITHGFLFGTDKKRCDVLLSERRLRNISGVHFCITFDEEGRLVLKDVSTRQTAVSYNNRGTRHWRRGFSWILSLNGMDTRIHLPNGFCFEITVPTHSSCQEQYLANVKAYLEASKDAAVALERLNLPSQDPTRPRTPMDDPIFIPIATLGRGAFGTVNKVVNVSDGTTYASKMLSPPIHLNDPDYPGITASVSPEKNRVEALENMFEKEIQMMKNISHEHIVKFVCSTLRPLQLIMEYMPLGSLRHQNKVNPISSAEIRLVLTQGLDALRYLHSEDITHRDIKPENILVQGRGEFFHIKLGDFGLSKEGSHLISHVGTDYYEAPEIKPTYFTNIRYDNKVDIWSLGVVLLEYADDIPMVHKSEHHSAIASKAQHVANSFPESTFFYLLSRMLILNPPDRASADELFEGESTIELSSEYCGDTSGSRTPTNSGIHNQSVMVSASPDSVRHISAANLQSPTGKRPKLSSNSNSRRVKRRQGLVDGDSTTQLQSDKTVRNVSTGVSQLDSGIYRHLEYSHQYADAGDLDCNQSGVVANKQVSWGPGSTYSSGERRERWVESFADPFADPFSENNEHQGDPDADNDPSFSAWSQRAITRDLTSVDRPRRIALGAQQALSNNNYIRLAVNLF
ncbi:STE protein kinase [Emergomyces pasteurianus Ep9510]|uniref:non-specific serine/threonine protein kinase n=1 Tax=Emergomyces pasteurianus Ep9510 TaxID=1447872 RepID=A0A1J9PIM8_9EURO|nr:STE protein kinase [Emergomyces pasteurianus Ep9510]